MNLFKIWALWVFILGRFFFGWILSPLQKAEDVWKKDVWDFQAFSQTFLELRFSLGNEGKGGKNLNSQTCMAWNSQTSFSQTSAATRPLINGGSGRCKLTDVNRNEHRVHA